MRPQSLFQFRVGCAAFSLLALGASGARAEAPTNEELKRQVDILAAEVQKLRTGEQGAESQADQSVYGLSPGASKVYRRSQGVSLGGYGQMLYENFAEKTHAGVASGVQDKLDLMQVVLYAGYRFDDHWIFNSETEFEHGGTEGSGAVNVEFAYMDYLYLNMLNVRAGLLLIPMGFLNEYHEPTVFLGTHRPEVEKLIIPSTWSEAGFGFFGDVGSLSYRTYLVTGMNASKFSDPLEDPGIRPGRQAGREAIAESWASVTRVDYTGTPGILAGISAFLGNATTELDPSKGGGIAIPMHLYEAHFEFKERGLQFRALGAYGFMSKIEELNARRNLTGESGVGNEQGGYYLELGYDLHSGEKSALIPFVRWESLNTEQAVPFSNVRSPSEFRQNFTLGMNYKPIDQVVLKADYQVFLLGDASGVNQWNLAAGYVF